MEKFEETATISLTRLKELEAKEDFFNQVTNDKDKCLVVRYTFMGGLIILSPSKAQIEITKALTAFEQENDRLREELNKKQYKFW